MTITDNITVPVRREIVKDFAELVKTKKVKGSRPEKTVIDFRTDRQLGIEREIWMIPTNVLRFRKDNGRIASDVLDYENKNAPLDEKNEQDQQTLREFLYKKDPENTKKLINDLLSSGQREPAIVTCDGFLINGNRRKMAFEELQRHNTRGNEFSMMKVVILPDGAQEGDPSPTLEEILQIEYKYQFQEDGKSEYTNFDRAPTLKRNIEAGFSLEQQLRNDPNYANLPIKQLKKSVSEFESKFLKPLECVDDYLQTLGREGMYSTISEGPGDKEGRWQAFIDFYSYVQAKLLDSKKRIELGVEDEEVGDIVAAAYQIIRLRDLHKLGKCHMVIRQIPSMLQNQYAKKQLLEIPKKVTELTEDKLRDENGKAYSVGELDRYWAGENAPEIIKRIKIAQQHCLMDSESEEPLELLELALKKLTNENMDIGRISPQEVGKARDLITAILDRATEINQNLYHHIKSIKGFKSLSV